MFASVYVLFIRLGIASLLFVNAVAILNKQRFLRKHRLTIETARHSDDESLGVHDHPPQDAGIRLKIASLIHSIQMMRPILIFINILTVLFLLIAGGFIF